MYCVTKRGAYFLPCQKDWVPHPSRFFAKGGKAEPPAALDDPLK